MLAMTWVDGAGATTLLPSGTGYFRFGKGRPDVLLLAGAGGMGLALMNGAVDPANRAAQLGTLDGKFRVSLDGVAVINEALSLPDGTAAAYSQPGVPLALPQVAVGWLMRDAGDGLPLSDLVKHFETANPYYKGKPGYDEPEPDQAGSPRMTEYAPLLALGAAFLYRLGHPVPPIYRAAAADWTRLQYRRPYIYYHQDTGEPWRFSSEADSWADEKGWRKSGKATVERPSLCTYQAADNEHLTLDREWAAAVLWNDPLAWRLLEHQGEAICSWPACRWPIPAGNLRAYGRTLKALALLAGAFGGKRPQFVTAFGTALSGLLSTESNLESDWPSLRPAPAKGLVAPSYTHVGMTQADIDAHPEMPVGELNERMRAVIVPWLGTVGTAVEIALTIPALGQYKSHLLKLRDDVRACMLGPGRDVEGLDNDGQPAFPVPFHDSYAAWMEHRVKRANVAWNGTVTEWTAVTVAALAREGSQVGQDIASAMKGNCSDLKGITLQGLEAYWPLLVQ